LAKNVAKGKMTEEERVQTRSRITGSTDIKDLKDVDFVIEVSRDRICHWNRAFGQVLTIHIVGSKRELGLEAQALPRVVYYHRSGCDPRQQYFVNLYH
jgi:hypothetical protein